MLFLGSRSGRVLKRRLYEGFDTFLAETEKGSTDILMGMLGMKDTSVKEALAGARSEEARRAILDEIGNMINYSVGYYIKYDQIPLNLRRNILRSFMFVKEKYHPDGRHDNTKARFVGDGAHQSRHSYDIISSTTVDLLSVFLLLSLASYSGARIICYDVKSAFLNASFTDDDEVMFLKISRDIVQIWKTLDANIANFTDEHGHAYLCLEKFIYGLKQAPKKFQEHLKQTLISSGYVQSIIDNCLFIKKQGDWFSILSTHVDDIMQVTNNDDWASDLKELLTSVYKSIACQDPGVGYLGMDIRRGKNLQDIYVSQPKLTQDILEMYLTAKDRVAPTPSRLDILSFDEPTDQSLLEPVNVREYLSLVMKLMYLARLTRPDILFSVSYLATKSQNPTLQNYNDAIRVVRYLLGTSSYDIHIHCVDWNLYAHCDASYGTHHDGKRQSGFIFSLGSTYSYLFARSIKQKVGSLSSTDAEILAARSCTQMLAWIQDLMHELDIESLSPAILYQDNQSAIIVYNSDTHSYKRVKHLLTSIGFIQSMIERGLLKILHLPSADMTADMATKSLCYQQHVKHTFSCGVHDLSELG